MEDFANYLYQLRIKNGHYISQQTLSRLSGYSQTYLSLLETGKAIPSKRCIKTIYEVLKIKGDALKHL